MVTHQCPWYEVLTSLTVKRNCMAQTRRQHKFNESARAHSARVTSYTIVYSSGLIRLLGVTVNGEIFSRKISESSANSRDTRHNRPRLVRVSLAPASWSFWFLDKDEDQEAFKGNGVEPAPAVNCPPAAAPWSAGAGEGVAWLGNLDNLEMSKPPFALGLLSWCTGAGGTTVCPNVVVTLLLLLLLLLFAPATGLTLLTECLDVERVDRLRACEWFSRWERLLTLSWEWFSGCLCVDDGVVAAWCGFPGLGWWTTES